MRLLKLVLSAFMIVHVAGALATQPAVESRTASAGRTFRDCPECPEMILIPAGEFTMARKSASDGRRDDDPEGIPKSSPAREVTLEEPFALGVYDVTREEFAAFVRDTGWRGEPGCYVWSVAVWVEDRQRSWRDPGFPQTDRDPVVCVNWEDAQAYIRWLNDRASKAPPADDGSRTGTYRLPRWEEEEYAAGGGVATAYAWGGDARRDRANYGADRCFPCRPERRGDGWLHTSPVGSFPPNALGLYDMAGNVWQWTGNCVRGSLSGLRWDAPTAGERCASAALHGGSWLTNPEYLRVGAYALIARGNRNQTTGFRVARGLKGDGADAPKSVPVPLTTPASALTETGASASSGQPVTGGSMASGKSFRDCARCPEMIVIPPGSFNMGSAPAGHGWDVRDVPEHRVTIPRAFAVAIYDVTRAQYRLFVQETRRQDVKGCDVIDPEGRWITDPGRSWHDPGFHQTDDDPVVCVSWEDAQAYVQWLNSQRGARRAPGRGAGPYRLLTEAEWEYAARAGSSTPFYWGAEARHDYANYGLEQCYPCGATIEGKDRWYYTSPVGSFAPNAFGLYDMLGNVWQWTQDCMHYGYTGAPQDGSVWEGGECRLRVLRGGSWIDPARFTTVTLRNPWAPDNHNQANGIRVARSLD